jgi:hypothetical protein
MVPVEKLVPVQTLVIRDVPVLVEKCVKQDVPFDVEKVHQLFSLVEIFMLNHLHDSQIVIQEVSVPTTVEKARTPTFVSLRRTSTIGRSYQTPRMLASQGTAATFCDCAATGAVLSAWAPRWHPSNHPQIPQHDQNTAPPLGSLLNC